MQNRVVKLKGFKKQPIGDRICRSVYQDDKDWAEVQGNGIPARHPRPRQLLVR